MDEMYYKKTFNKYKMYDRKGIFHVEFTESSTSKI